MQKEESKIKEEQPSQAAEENKQLLDFLIKAQKAVQNEEEINPEAADILKGWIIEERVKANDELTEQSKTQDK